MKMLVLLSLAALFCPSCLSSCFWDEGTEVARVTEPVVATIERIEKTKMKGGGGNHFLPNISFGKIAGLRLRYGEHEKLLTTTWKPDDISNVELIADVDGRRFMYKAGSVWHTLYREEKEFFIDPDASKERRPWSQVASFAEIASKLFETPDAARVTIALKKYSPKERGLFLFETAETIAAQRNVLWRGIAEDLPEDESEKLSRQVLTKYLSTIESEQLVKSILLRRLIILGSTDPRLEKSLLKVFSDAKLRHQLPSLERVLALDLISKTDREVAAKHACSFFTKDMHHKKTPALNSVLLFLVNTKTQCPLATAFAKTLGYCCTSLSLTTNTCDVNKFYKSSTDLLESIKKEHDFNNHFDIYLLAFLKDTKQFPHLPAYDVSQKRKNYTQPMNDAECIGAAKAGQTCSCDVALMRRSACLAPTQQTFELRRLNCRFNVNDKIGTFDNIVAMRAQGTRVWIKISGSSQLICKHENLPFAGAEPRYRWLMNGETLPTYDRAELHVSALQAEPAKGTKFSCEIEFTSGKQLIANWKKALKGKKTPTQTAFKSQAFVWKGAPDSTP